MSKLPQDRSQRMLVDLISQPGNNECADCKASSPRWASYNIGIFLCVSCASIHRKMGTHISKVKSVNLDQWTKEQVDSIRVTGNLNSNAIFNPNDIPPPTDLINSERDSELEKYIRNKYQFRKLMKTNRGFSSSSATSRGTGSELASTSFSVSFSASPGVAAGRSRAREMLTPEKPKASLSQPTAISSPHTAVVTSRPSASPLLIDPITSSQTQQQPPLQILASAPAAQHAVPQATATPASFSLQSQPPQSVPQGIWGDMMALQSGPAPVPQQQSFPFMQYQQQFLSPSSGVGVGVTSTFTGMPAYGTMAPPGVISPVPSTFQSSLSPQMGATMNGMMYPQATGMFTTPSPQIPLQSTPSPSLFPPSIQPQPPLQMQVPMMTATPAYQSMQPQAVFQFMTMTQQQQQQQQQPFGAAVNQPLYTGMVPAPGNVHPQQPWQQWPGNPNTNPYAGGAPWYG